MKSNDFATKLNEQIFGIEFNRFVKIVCGLRLSEYCGSKLYPDARQNSSAVTPVHVAHLLRALALNFNPKGKDFYHQIARAHTLRDQDGRYFIDTLVDFLSNPEEITTQGLVRISFSQDRDTIIFVYRSPLVHRVLQNSYVSRFVVKEHEQVFGEDGPLKFERFSIVKQSALLQVAAMLSNTEEVKSERKENLRVNILHQITGRDKLKQAREIRMTLVEEEKNLLGLAKTKVLTEIERERFERVTVDAELLKNFIEELEQKERNREVA